ncbi:hypothetical protein PAF17_07150 [Paracoccus sp. Z330]|uniref:AAA+ ATPase domain-containing protein n=1 Tax=Paracoccus onchidii TaxID=3017813 RepID=A0ABT4ZF19_9RHOB|nr:hypothetical protein [Paracoccus onchidii]MDB6177285.1 hypothetical protein [Paracoccus onchidii]
MCRHTIGVVGMTGAAHQDGYSCPVFDTMTDPSLLYPSAAEQAAFSSLRQALTGASPVTLLLGVEGIGKTQLLNVIRSRLSESHKIASITLEEFETDAPGPDDGAGAGMAADDLIQSIREFAIEDEGANRPAHTPALLIVDDADQLPDGAFEQLLQVCASLTTADPPVQLLLSGLPQLQAHLKEWQDGALQQYVDAEILFATLTEQETAGYVAHRFATLDCACHGGRNPFNAAAMGRLHHHCGGVPGRVGDLARLCLAEAGRVGATVITAEFVDACERGELPETVAGMIALSEPAPHTKTGEHIEDALIDSQPVPEMRAPAPVSIRAAPNRDPAVAPRASRSRGWVWSAASGVVLAAFAGGLIWNQLSGRRDTVAMMDPSGAVVAPSPPRPPAPTITPQAEPRPAVAEVPPPPHIRLSAMPDPRELLDQALESAVSDPAFAALLYERAALLGNDRAAYFLGQLFEIGDGVSMDPHRAHAWYQAAENNDRAAGRIEALAPFLSASEASGAAPVPVLQASLPDGRLALHWRAAAGENPSRFAVEFVAAGDDGAPQRRETGLSAMLLDQQVIRWRVVTLTGGGDDQGATEWFDAPLLARN